MSSEAYEEHEEVEGAGLPPFLRDPAGMVRRRWRWMLLASSLGVLATLALVWSLKPSYRAEASVLVESQQIPESFVRPTVEEDSLQRIDAMVGRVLTRERLVDLMERYELYPDRHEATPTAELVAAMRQAISIEPARGFGTSRDSARIFTVRFEAPTPDAAARVTNEIAGLLPAESVRSRTKQARLTTDFLRKELERAEAELREQNALIRDFKERYRGELPSELQANLGKLERLQQQRQSLALQIAEASNRVAELSQAGGAGPGGPGARLETLRAELARELSLRTERHPSVVALKDEIARVEAELAAAPDAPATAPTAALVQVEQSTLRELRSQLAETEIALRTLDAQVANTPARQEELAALEEKAEVLRETYTEFLRKVQEAELAQSLEAAQHGERVSVLNWAGVPSQPVRTRWKYLAVGLVVSLGMGLGVGVLFETIDPVLISARQVESASGLPVLGSIPRIA